MIGLKLSQKWSDSRGLRLAAAALLNAVVLGFILLVVNVGFESNDDLVLSAFVDGQMSSPDAHIPYINYLYGLLLKFVYDVFGRGVAWYTVAQYALLFSSFTAVSFVLFERLRFWQASLVSIIMLLFFGVDAYTIISYTKTAGICAVGGMLLISYAMAAVKEKGWRIGMAAFGVLLCLVGFMLRPMEFLPCFALMTVLSMAWLYSLIFEHKDSIKNKFGSFLRYALPFVLMLVLCAGLYAFNEAAWSKEPWSFYHEFDAKRVDCVDFGRPEYGEMAEGYESLGLSETAVKIFRDSSYFDPDVFSGETLDGISCLRDEIYSTPSIGGLFQEPACLWFPHCPCPLALRRGA